MYNIITLYNLEAFTTKKKFLNLKCQCEKYSVCDSMKESPTHQVGRITVPRKKHLLDLTQPFRYNSFFLKHHQRSKVKDKFTFPLFLFCSLLFISQKRVHNLKNRKQFTSRKGQWAWE